MHRVILVMMFVMLPTGIAWATIKWSKLFNSLYSPSASSTLHQARCASCHIRSNGKNGLNAYGKQLNGKSASRESLKSIESKDADGDGVSNITEIRAGTLPGDPKSRP